MSDLATLFARDPNKCTKDDIRAIVLAFRDRRKQFNAGASLAGKVKPVTGKAAETAQKIASNDLDL